MSRADRKRFWAQSMKLPCMTPCGAMRGEFEEKARRPGAALKYPGGSILHAPELAAVFVLESELACGEWRLQDR